MSIVGIRILFASLGVAFVMWPVYQIDRQDYKLNFSNSGIIPKIVKRIISAPIIKAANSKTVFIVCPLFVSFASVSIISSFAPKVNSFIPSFYKDFRYCPKSLPRKDLRFSGPDFLVLSPYIARGFVLIFQNEVNIFLCDVVTIVPQQLCCPELLHELAANVFNFDQ